MLSMNSLDNKGLPLVTVFTLIYNTNPEFVIEAIESIRAQTYPNIEHIIIDDCSTVIESKQVVKDWIHSNKYKCIFIEHDENNGICKTLNKILQLANGKYIFGCSDDIALPDKVKIEVMIMESLSDAYAAVYSDAYFIDEDSNRLYGLFIQRYRNFSFLPEGDLFEILLEGNFLPMMAMLFRTESLRKIGGFDDQLIYEDYDLHLRLSRYYKYALNKEISAEYRVHASQLSKKNDIWFSNNLRIYSKHADIPLARKKIEDLFFNKYIYSKTLSCFTKSDLQYLEYIDNRLLSFCIRYSVPRPLFKLLVKCLIRR